MFLSEFQETYLKHEICSYTVNDSKDSPDLHYYINLITINIDTVQTILILFIESFFLFAGIQ